MMLTRAVPTLCVLALVAGLAVPALSQGALAEVPLDELRVPQGLRDLMRSFTDLRFEMVMEGETVQIGIALEGFEEVGGQEAARVAITSYMDADHQQWLFWVDEADGLLRAEMDGQQIPPQLAGVVLPGVLAPFQMMHEVEIADVLAGAHPEIPLTHSGVHSQAFGDVLAQVHSVEMPVLDETGARTGMATVRVADFGAFQMVSGFDLDPDDDMPFSYQMIEVALR